MKKWSTALGFYQEISTVQAVLSKLKQKNFSRVATIHHQHDDNFEVNRFFPLTALIFPSFALLAAICLALLNYFSFIDISWSILLIPIVVLIALATIYTFSHFSGLMDSSLINRFKHRVMIDEILVLVQVHQSEVREVLAILRQVSSGHPVTFLLRPALFEEGEMDIAVEPLTLELIREEAAKLAYTLESSTRHKKPDQSILTNLQKIGRTLQLLRRDIADAEYIEQTVPSSAEWLLDNMYVLEGSMEDVKQNLSKKYYKELPKIDTGTLAGLPRIYALAIELVKNTAGALNRENIVAFLESYQQQHPLTIGELWAFPLMLRFRLIEWLEFLAIRVDNRMREGEFASFWGNRLLSAIHHEPNRLPLILSELSGEPIITISGHFAEELLDHLFDEETVLPLVREWLENYFSSPITDVVRQEQLHETSEQVVFSNSVRSLIVLSQLSWTTIFENVSPVDAVLREDPAEVYLGMDFATRNSYRTALEEIAVRTHLNELEVSRIALTLSRERTEKYQQHIGYYLIDKGREVLEQKVEYRPTWLQLVHRWIFKHPKVVYLGGIISLTAIMESIAYTLLANTAISLQHTITFLILALLPIFEVSVQFVHMLLTKIIPISLRPKMLFETGIPIENKTLVVVPIMLTTPEAITKEINNLEIRYLANSDPAVLFGLFSDFSDAPQQHMDNDKQLLSIAMEGIEALESKYGIGTFFLFHRQRVWSDCENAWIGQERKRGKLEYLNRFLMSESLPENIVYTGLSESLKGIRYLITLDSDTQLPKDQAKALIEVISHPLNRPYLSDDKKTIKRGYTIIQPRVATDFIHAKVSWFCKIFSEPSVVDPYTQAISNIYQDLVEEGSYHGKGIYDLETFHTILSQRFPDEHILSHDLLEGSFVRTAFASNICLLDKHPQTYMSWSLRQHRWIRGDWQIIDWLLATVPTRLGEKEKNPLSWYNQWKIFDNLRRALLPIALLSLLVIGWIIPPLSEMWTGLALLVLLLPCIILCINRLCTSFFTNTKGLFRELKVLFLRALITVTFLPFDAFNSIDAMVRVIFRRLISKKNLLQWTSSDSAENGSIKTHQKFILQLGWVSLFGIIILGAVALVNPHTVPFVFPFCILWFFAPVIAYIIDRPLERKRAEGIPQPDQQLLRKIGRKTWRYFDELVGPQTHWLPPDNYQTALNVEVAQRTSPTNIGMWLLAVMSAYDFKYVTCDQLIDKTLATIQQLRTLEHYEGHLLNWYDIRSLNPLYPRYVSTVDSGNLLACFWTLKQGLTEMFSSAITPEDALEGLKDTYEIYQEDPNAPKIEGINRLFHRRLSSKLPLFIKVIKEVLQSVESMAVEPGKEYWLKQIEEQLRSWDSIISRYFNWVSILGDLPLAKLQQIDSEAPTWKKQLFSRKFSLETVSNQNFIQPFEKLIHATQKNDLPPDIQSWGKKLQEELSRAQWLAGEKVGQLGELVRELDQLSEGMSLKFLYDDTRKLFTIGYNIDDKRLDNSYYDLLASEARIASLVAIAKGDAPLEHWWALGRVYSTVEGRSVLMSWGGTMFEYLMPLIFSKHYPDSLLGEACNAAVACQIEYGNKRGIPWGISESAFSGIDAHKIYQYKSFGIPGLGLKRGLEDDLVVSPYSTALALAVDSKSAIVNLKKMSKKNDLMGPYGYFESMDFTRQKSPEGERGVIVHTYMAHHQGMIVTSINNALNNDILLKRFHKDPRICGVDSLLYERIPLSPPIKVTGIRKEPSLRRLEPFSVSPIMGVVETPQSVTPKIILLSNENYSMMISSTGGGYAHWRDMDIYRWRADTTKDSWGSFCYIKDMKSSEIWSTTYQPTQNYENEYSVNFKGDKAEFRRKDHQIESFTEIVVSPEDDVEIRLITLVNHSTETRHLELTSYLELVLAPHLTDRAHPGFNKLFIETEALPGLSAILAFRRLRSSNDLPLWAAHSVSMSSPTIEPVQYETDREQFIGRGKTLQHPAAMDKDLSGTTGTVLDPIFSLRRRVVLEPGKRVQLSFITAISDNRNATVALIEKYKDIGASHRALELAWTYAQLELRHLRIHQEEVQLFQKLASRVLYPHAQLRTIEDRLRKNQLGQSALWSQGISGDFPIVVVAVGDIYDTDLVKQVLIAHAFWCMRGLKVDLIVFNEEEIGYLQPLHEHLQSLVQAYSYRCQIDTPGGVYLKNLNLMPPGELNLILALARAVLIGARGSLRQQLVSPKAKKVYSQKLFINEKIKEEPSSPLPFLELPYFNGLGGYSADGRSYVIYLGPDMNTPAPWCNVLANSQFGTLVSEAGLGMTWYGNSQTNRLTPWSNDSLLDPISDTIYIRDEELGTFWTPTPAPIRELDAYRISHSQGFSLFEHHSHGIEQELLVFVPVNDEGGLPLRIQRLSLTNRSSRRRRLTLTAYTEWVLGSDREDTQIHLVTEWDLESQALFAYNRYNPDFGSHVAFAFAVTPISSFSGDRTEFLGRNRSTDCPEALERKGLSGKTGAALDACAALQVYIELESNANSEVVFILGYAPDIAKARELISQCRNEGKVEQLFTETKSWWDKTLETIQVDVPDLATNFAMNRWLKYQTLCCRFWGRSGFYQSSGAYGFRDQLQDVMTIAYSHPDIAREYILKAASRQFVEGDVQHWWHAQTGAGVRTRCSDDLLWLPFVTAHYVRMTGDTSILNEHVKFLESPQLEADQEEVFQIPTISQESESLLEHCRRALKKGTTAGPHGLPLIGSCDWNDGMSRVGIQGEGESVWLAWFLTHVMNDFADLLEFSGDKTSGTGLRDEAKRLAKVVEANAWDGAWYRRAYFDDGTPIGSKDNIEAKIDSIAQSWAVISGLANPERCATALNSAQEYLVKSKENVVLLLTPPFDKTPMDPGYIKGYPPGVRENGGQYTHGSSWLAMAYARTGNGDMAAKILQMISPTLHSPTTEANALYRVEPYVIAADIYDLKNQVGRGGWTWYTGSASWIYRIWLEEILGFKLRGNAFSIKCAIPKEWDGFKLTYRYKSSHYTISVTNPDHISTGVNEIKLDGVLLLSQEVPLVDDGGLHTVDIILRHPT